MEFLANICTPGILINDVYERRRLLVAEVNPKRFYSNSRTLHKRGWYNDNRANMKYIDELLERSVLKCVF